MTWTRLHPLRHPGPLMAALLIAWGLSSILWGERLLRSDGFGWDGLAYLRITRGLWEPNPLIWPYSGQRCLPSVIVRCTLDGLGLPLSGPNVLDAFALYNLGLLVLTLFVLLGVCREMGVGPRGRWLMFLGVFCNYVHLKQHYYSACVTDVWAFAFAALALYAYLRRSGAGVLLASFAGAFTWPVLFHYGAVLFLFPRRSPVPAGAALDSPGRPAGAPYRLHLIFAGLAAAAIVTVMAFLVWSEGFFGIYPHEIIKPLLPLSMACSGAYVFFGLKGLLDDRRLYDWREYLSLGALVRAGVLAAAFLLLCFVQFRLRYLWARPGDVLTADEFFKMVMVTSIAKPFLFLVAHVVWYGPIILAMVFFWGRICREAQAYGPGMVLSLAFGLFLALNPESRQAQTVFPILAVLAAKVLEGLNWTARRWTVFTALALLLSKAWLPLNLTPWPELDRLFEFPIQLFLMSFGGCMTTWTYLLQGAGVLLAAGVMAWVTSSRRTAVRAEPETRGRLAA